MVDSRTDFSLMDFDAFAKEETLEVSLYLVVVNEVIRNHINGIAGFLLNLVLLQCLHGICMDFRL